MRTARTRRPRRTAPSRRASRVAAVVAVACLALAACSSDDGGGDGGEPEAGPEGQEVSKGATLDATWPMTGLPVTGSQSAAQEHPVMVVKMDNTPSSAPQRGLDAADLVVEELVEGGVTRLAAFYYSSIPGTVGPVRSMRASDIGIVKPADAAVVTSGAAPVTLQRVRGAGIEFFGEGSQGFFRDTARSAPYNLFTDLAATTTLVEGEEARPDDYLPWGESEDLPRGRPAPSLAASFGSHTTTWTHGPKGWTNTNSFAAEDEQFPADTVLVLRVRVGDAGYRDPAGNPVPETILEGKGEAMLFHDGRVVTGHVVEAVAGAARSRSPRAARSSPSPRGGPGSSWCRRRPARSASADPGPGPAGPYSGSGAPACSSAWKPADDEADGRLHPGRGGDRVVGAGHGLAGRRHRAEEDPREGLQHVLVEVPRAGGQHRAHDLEDVGEGRALLLLAEALVAQDRGALLDHDPPVAPAPAPPRGRPAGRPGAFTQGSWWLFSALAMVRAAWDSTRSKTASNSACLPREVVVERALGDLGAGHDRVERGAGVPVLGEELLGDVDQRALGRGGVLLRGGSRARRAPWAPASRPLDFGMDPL